MPENDEILNQAEVTTEPEYKRIRLHPVENGEERKDIILWPETGLEGQVSELAEAVGNLGSAALKDYTASVTSESTDLVTSGAVYTAIDDVYTTIENLPEPMVFKGSVGAGGTVSWENLPSAASANEGYTYKVITDHIADEKCPTCKIGDTIISNGAVWTVIPSGDEPSGTVTSVGLSADNDSHITVSGSPITSSGILTISIDSDYSIPSNTDQAAWGAKQDAISDLSTIRNGAAAGATAVQPADLTSYVNKNSANIITGANTFSGNNTFTGSLNKFGSQTAGVVSRQVFQLNDAMDNGGSIRIGDPYYLSAETAGKGRYIEIDGNDVQVWQNKENSPDYNSNVTEGDQLSTYREVTSLYLQDYGGDTYLCSGNYQAVAKGKLVSRKAFTAEDTALIKGAATFNSAATIKGAATFNSTAKFANNILAHQYNKDSATSYTAGAEVVKDITIPTISVTANGSSILKTGEVGIYWGSTRSTT